MGYGDVRGDDYIWKIVFMSLDGELMCRSNFSASSPPQGSPVVREKVCVIKKDGTLNDVPGGAWGGGGGGGGRTI